MEPVTVFAPGRVNLIGEHTDYNDGLALPFAIQHGVTIRARLSSDDSFHVDADDLDEHDTFTVPATKSPGWRAFARGVVAELIASGVDVAPAEISIASTLEQQSGLSSSAALSVALCLALRALTHETDIQPLEVAKLCSAVERRWVGANTGLLDQLAVLCCTEHHALRIDFRSLEWRRVAMPVDAMRFALFDSGAHRENAASGYNQRRAECAEIVARLGLESLRDVTSEQAATLPPPLDGRALHVINENQRVDAMAGALHAADPAAVASLLDASHASLRDLYDVSTSEVEATVQRAKEAGALGARVMGGGFGGRVLAVFEPDAQVPTEAQLVTPSAGAHRIEVLQ